ncbi:MAG: pilus assembly protein N-terminal domain-containing protein [Pseudomonadota bacterium]
MKTALIAVLTSFLIAPTALAQQLWVTMDQVRSYTVDRPADSIIVGNPGIADVSVQNSKQFLLFGKAPGLTNIIVLDEEGETIKNLQVRVNPPSANMLVYHRGSARTTYNCTRHCDVALTVGDSSDAFGLVNSQVQTKLGQAANGEDARDLQEGEERQ